MKRIISGLAILLAVSLSALLVSHCTEKYTDEATDQIEISQEYYHKNDLENAIEYAEAAFNGWQTHQSFNDVFIRHSETDSAYDAFCQLTGALQGDDDGEILTAYSQLLGHLDCIRRMEHFRIGSIF